MRTIDTGMIGSYYRREIVDLPVFVFAMTSVVVQTMLRREGLRRVGGGWYHEKQEAVCDIAAGKSLYEGFQGTIHTGSNSMLLSSDVSSAVMWPKMCNLLDLVKMTSKGGCFFYLKCKTLDDDVDVVVDDGRAITQRTADRFEGVRFVYKPGANVIGKKKRIVGFTERALKDCTFVDKTTKQQVSVVVRKGFVVVVVEGK